MRLSGVALSSEGGNVTSAGCQVTLCDRTWHVSFRSGVATLRTAIHLFLVTYSGVKDLGGGNKMPSGSHLARQIVSDSDGHCAFLVHPAHSGLLTIMRCATNLRTH